MIISIDIGSTWTKGACLDFSAPDPVVCAASHPTTTDNLSEGFDHVLSGIHQGTGGRSHAAPIRWSSSAKGGLGIAAIGIVPELTVEAARITAMSAGGRLIRSIAYKLDRKTVGELETLKPDIILLTGGTDGGNEYYNVHNARMLADSNIESAIIYAGNRSIAEEVTGILAGKDISIVENIMPDIGELNPEPARGKIRQLFLSRIVSGRGLSGVCRTAGSEPKPTPLAVYELVQKIPEHVNGWSDFMLIDMGGATTDIYSNTEGLPESSSTVQRGLKEPQVKRTVEGDLGMRVSAKSLYETARGQIREDLDDRNEDTDDIERYIEEVTAERSRLPQSATEKTFDRILAKSCVLHSLARHSGMIQRVFTPAGETFVRKGRDLRNIKRIVGSGGYLSKNRFAGDMTAILSKALPATDGSVRMMPPADAEYVQDSRYMWPLLGNIVADFPQEASEFAVRCAGREE